MKSWKEEFRAGEKFPLKGRVFELVNVGKRSLVLRPVKDSEDKSKSEKTHEE